MWNALVVVKIVVVAVEMSAHANAEARVHPAVIQCAKAVAMAKLQDLPTNVVIAELHVREHVEILVKTRPLLIRLLMIRDLRILSLSFKIEIQQLLINELCLFIRIVVNLPPHAQVVHRLRHHQHRITKHVLDADRIVVA